ncbi:hypothetical protein [Vulcanisaeta sp. JCM 14467]
MIPNNSLISSENNTNNASIPNVSEMNSEQNLIQTLDKETMEILKEVRAKILRRIDEVDDVFNRTIEDLVKFREHLMSLAEKYNNVSDNIKAFAEAIERIIDYTNKVKQWYKDKVYGEITKLVKDEYGEIRRRRSGLTIVGQYVTITANKINGKIIVMLTIKGIGGINTNVPPLISELIRRSIQVGLMNTDGSIDKKSNHPRMNTVYLWQIILWLLAFPGKNYLIISRININKKDVKLMWSLISLDYKFKEKPKLELTFHNVLITYFTAVLGDGYIVLQKKQNNRIYPEAGLTGKQKLDLWEKMLRIMVGNYHKRNKPNVSELRIFQNAIQVLKMIYNEITVNEPILINILIFFTSRSNGEKIKRFINSLNLKIRRKGDYSIILAGKKFTVDTSDRLRLICRVNDENEAKKILEKLRSQYSITANVYRSGKYLAVNADSIIKIIEKNKELRDAIITILYHKYEDISDEKKKQLIRKYIMNLTSIKEDHSLRNLLRDHKVYQGMGYST